MCVAAESNTHQLHCMLSVCAMNTCTGVIYVMHNSKVYYGKNMQIWNDYKNEHYHIHNYRNAGEIYAPLKYTHTHTHGSIINFSILLSTQSLG